MLHPCRWLALGFLLSPVLGQTFAPLVRPVHVGNPSAFDTARRRLVMFDEDGTTWELDGGDLLPRTSHNGAPRPPLRTGHTMCYDEARRRVLMFGGTAGSFTSVVFFNDTWTYDGSGWTQLTSSGPEPTPRSAAALTWDSTRNRAVLWGGGVVGTTVFNDTWEHDGNSWLQRSPATSPVGRPGIMAFDRQRSVAVLVAQPSFGAVAADTWEWNGTNWALRATLSGAGVDGGQTMVFDPLRNRTVLAGTTDRIYEWDGSAWSPSAPLPQAFLRIHAAGWFDPTSGGVALAGGLARGGSARRADQWQWNGQALTQVKNDAGPVASAFVASHGVMFADPPRGRVVRFGGTGAFPYSAETWALANGAWSAVPSPTSPSARIWASATHDLLRGESLLFGGSGTGGLLGDTWSFGSTGWVARSTTGGPAPRTNAAMAADLLRNVVVLFGGMSSGPLDDTWEWNGTLWTLRATTVRPAPRTGAAMAFHPLLGRMLLFGGVGLTATHSDTWTWDGANWTQLQPATVPPPLSLVSMGSSLVSHRCLLVGRIDVASPPRQQVWAHDGTDWQQVMDEAILSGGLSGGCVSSPGLDAMICIRNGAPAAASMLSFAAGRVATIGTGCGTPTSTLLVRSRPRIGAPNGLELVANPGRAVLFALDPSSGNTPIGGGCTVWLSPGFLGLFQLSDAAGFASQPLFLPATALGLDLFAQAAVLEPLSSNGLVLTQGLRLTLGD